MEARRRLLANLPELFQVFPRIAAKYGDLSDAQRASARAARRPSSDLPKTIVLPVSTMGTNRLH